jgi:hypothetical protein
MANKNQKFNITFWQLFTLLVISMVLGGVVYNYAFNNQLQDEINSTVFIPSPNKDAATAPAKKPILK